MAKGSYTIFVLSDAASPPRKLHVSKSVVGALASVSAIVFIGFGFFVYEYVNLNVRMLELKQLRREAGEHNMMAEKLRRLEGEISKVRELDQRVRVAMGLDKSEARPAILAQGGADAETRDALRDAVGQRTVRLLDWVGGDLTTLAQEIASREQGLRELQTHLDKKTAVLAATPTILPIKGLVTASYGYRKSPFTGKREFHEGMDIAARGKLRCSGTGIGRGLRCSRSSCRSSLYPACERKLSVKPPGEAVASWKSTVPPSASASLPSTRNILPFTITV